MCRQSCNHVEPFGKSKVNVVINRAVTYLSKPRCLKSKNLQWIVHWNKKNKQDHTGQIKICFLRYRDVLRTQNNLLWQSQRILSRHKDKILESWETVFVGCQRRKYRMTGERELARQVTAARGSHHRSTFGRGVDPGYFNAPLCLCSSITLP